jgi:hypothetical protein
LAFAASRTFAIRPRTLEPVSGFVVQIDFGVASTSTVLIVSTGLSHNSAAYVASVDFHCPCFLVRKPAERASRTSSDYLAEGSDAAITPPLVNAV